MDSVAVITIMREFFKIHNILQYLSQYTIEYCNILQYDFSGDIHPYDDPEASVKFPMLDKCEILS
jgi:hypothetical protein